MTRRAPTLPRAPWHAPASRRVGRISPGFPTLLVCAIGVVPVAISAGRSVVAGMPIVAATADAPAVAPPASAQTDAAAVGIETATAGRADGFGVRAEERDGRRRFRARDR